jgi:hypothetical protein
VSGINPLHLRYGQQYLEVPVWVGPQKQVPQVGTPLQQLVQSLVAPPATSLISSHFSRLLSVSFASTSFLARFLMLFPFR